MRLLLLLTLFTASFVAGAQLKKLEEKNIPLDEELAKSENQFSGLARRNDEILLIAQNVAIDRNNKIYGVKTSVIDEALKPNGTISEYTTYYFRGLSELKARLAAVGETYDGLEGAVVVGENIFFTVETTTHTCYIVKGIFIPVKKDSAFIALDDHEFPIAKPDFYYNAGFESICYDEDQKRLMVFFEQNWKTGKYTVVSCTTSFMDDKYTTFKNPLYFRLTDVSYKKGATYNLIGLQHHYYRDTNEIKFYVGGKISEAKNQMKQQDPTTKSFTALISLNTSAKELSFSQVGYIEQKPDTILNWEGILHYNSGFLAIVDSPAGGKLHLSFFEFPSQKKLAPTKKKNK